MKTARNFRAGGQRGSALFVVFILAIVMAGVFGSLILYVNRTAKIEKRSNVRLESVYVAEYAFEKAYTELKGLLGQTNLPNLVQTTGATNLTRAPSSVFTPAAGYTWKTYLTVPIEEGLVRSTFSNLNTMASGATYQYVTVVEFDRTVPSMSLPVSMYFQREWIYTIKPLFQYAIFYNQDMELFPGAAFVVGGRVHSNGTIYTGTTASISFSDWVTHVSGVANHYSPDDPRSQGALNGPVSYAAGKPATATTREEPPGSLAQDGADSNHNNDGPRELIEIPRSWESDPSSTDRLYNNAGLKILVNSSGAVATADSGPSVPAKSGSNVGRVYLTKDGTTIPAGDALESVIDTVISGRATDTLPDYREGTAITTTVVNVENLNTAYSAGGLPATIPNASKWPNNNSVPAALQNRDIPVALRGKELWNGVLYVADISDSPSHPTGVQITHGEVLPDGSEPDTRAGLTIATNNPAYIVGNYNTGGNPPVNSGTDLAAANTVNGYTVRPAAVIADAVTILSTGWSDSYDSSTALGSRDAANTTINTALISGIVKSVRTGGDAAYSGGVENYLRLLEDWGSRRLTYYGSIINLYESQQATAKWQSTGVYYQAPARNWYFDVNFTDPTKLPPGTPMLRSIKRGQWAQIADPLRRS